MGSFLDDYLTPGRKYFSKSFFSYAPGGGFAYANTGAALAGYVLESATGRGFASITQETIFAPLGMQHAAWAPVPIAGAQNAVPHKGYKPIVPDEYPMLTPSGSLRTTTLDLSRFLQMFMHGGTRQGVRVLRGASVAEMARPQVPQLNSAMGLLPMPDAEREELIGYLSAEPEVGDLIPGTGGVRKLRWGLEGRGKRGGARIIYFFRNAEMPLFLLTAFAKNERADPSQAERNALRRLTKQWTDTYGRRGQ